MAQSFHETMQYTKWEEDLYYKTASVLVSTWPSRFSMDQNDPKGKRYAPDYLKNPQKLANAVYSNRLGNGDFASDEGWKFRGRGAFHLTFKANYLEASHELYGDERLIDNPDLVANDWNARWLTAGWFWKTNALNILADKDLFTKVSVAIQGDASTVPKRLESLRRANSIFK